MAVYGYIMVEGDIWLVTVHRDKSIRTVKRRSMGTMGSHLDEVQRTLERPEHQALIEQLRWGKRVTVPFVKP